MSRGNAARRAMWVLLVLALAALGIWLGAPDRASVRAAAARLRDTPVATGAIVIGGALAFLVAEAARIAVIAQLVGARLGIRAALDAAVANHVMTAVTPSIGLGEPSIAYVLGRRGIPWEVAVAIPFVKVTTSVALCFALGALLVVAGYGPPVDDAISAAATAVFAAIALAMFALLVLCANERRARGVIEAVRSWLARRRWLRSPAWQDGLDRAAHLLVRAVDRYASLRRAGLRGAGILLAAHLIYYAVYLAPIVGFALVLGDPPVLALWPRALVYLCFLSAMPTPGGAGPTEAAAGVFFADLVPPVNAIALVAVFRASTFYVQLAIGIAYGLASARLDRRDART